MIRGVWRGMSVLLLAVGISPLVGCQYDRIRQENEALWSQNKELQEELARNRLALDALESERDKLLSQQPPQGSFNVFTAGAAANTGTGFNQIEGVESIQTPEQVTVRIPGDVLFAPGKAALRNSARKTLNEIASVIKEEYASNTILINGYTDTDPIKKSRWSDNLELSLQRAAAVHRHLDKQGVDPKQMRAVGKGQWHPRSSKAKSRRVEIVVSLE